MRKSDGIVIDSPETMIAAIRHYGILPFFKGTVPGWSVEELTSPDCWFMSSEELGPWDWKIEVVREGDIAYGKYLGGKAGFMTADLYRHLMNWRRSLPKYKVAEGVKCADKTRSGILMRYLSPAALAVIRENGAADKNEIRTAVTNAVTPGLLRALGPAYKAKLRPAVKKSIIDSVIQFLEMGTWSVAGDFTRVYRGPNLEYSGWQRASFTTPDELFGSPATETTADKPSWARFLEGPQDEGVGGQVTRPAADCTPSESRELLVSHVLSFFPGHEDAVRKMI